MTSPGADQLIRLASDNESIYLDAWSWFLDRGATALPVLLQGLEDDRLGSVAHWRILLILRQLAVPATVPAILKSFRLAIERGDPIVLPGAMEALAVFHTQETVVALASVFPRGTIDNVKHAAALLGDIGDQFALESLATLLNHAQPEARESAVKALRKINSAAAREIIDQHRGRETNPAVRALIDSGR